jgi:hypothetical protein
MISLNILASSPRDVLAGSRIYLVWIGAQNQGAANIFQPFEIRLRIWSLMAPSPRILVQNKRLKWTPQYTQFQSEPTPAVMHVCRESRNEYLYREDDAANNAEENSHALYAPMFPDQYSKMIFSRSRWIRFTS